MSRRRRNRRRRTGAARTQPPPVPVRVWDLPTRLLHLMMILTLTGALVSIHLPEPWPAAHLWSGYLLLICVLARIMWGLVGSESARFRNFIPGPRSIVRYLPQLFSRHPTRWPGHNPVGALYVLVILLLLLLAALSGLYYESWGEWRGPLAERVSRAAVRRWSDLHSILQWPILLLVTVHLSAVFGYRWFKGEDRIRAMFGDGRLVLDRDPGLRFVPSARALVVVIAAAAAVGLIIWLGPVA